MDKVNQSSSKIMDLKVSIIIPVYNLEKYVASTIQSCLNQTYANVEVVIINDGSTDHSEDEIKKFLYDKRIKYIMQENSGVSVARNVGVRQATGDYITFLDGDDTLQTDTINRNVELISSFKTLPEWIAFPILRKDVQSVTIQKSGGNLLDSYAYTEVQQISAKSIFSMFENKKFPAIVCAMLYHKNFFDTTFLEGRFEDTLMVMQLLRKNPNVIISPYGAYYYLDREGSFINSKWSVSKWMDYTRVQIEIVRTAIFFYPEKQAHYVRRYIRMYYNLKFLKFKKRKDKTFAEPLNYLVSQQPNSQCFDFVLWTKYFIKCLISILYNKS